MRKKVDYETVMGGALLALFIFGFSLISYGFWSWIFK